MELTKLHNMVLAALFTALVIVGAYISFPLPFSPVPIVLQNLFVITAGLVLGWRWAAVSILLYLLLGAVGLPVFSAARGGLAHFVGPTGGYLVGFLAAAVVTGLISHIKSPRLWTDIVAVVSGTVVIYLFGVPWLKVQADMSWGAALASGLTPFLIGDVLKAAAAVGLAAGARTTLARLVPGAASTPQHSV
jgi:biotin transport system substrate-specific component